MKRSIINEGSIRDFIAKNLHLVESGLELVDTEFYLPNQRGASGFLDILARDAASKFVIIEIKRTNAAAREAIQELFKYVSLIRERFLIKKTDVRLILLSVEWHDLAKPYAELAASAPFEVAAGAIILDAHGVPVAINSITPAALTGERKIGVRHFLWGFPDQRTAAEAVIFIAQRLQQFGLADFVLIQSRAKNKTLKGRSFIYFAQRELLFEDYIALIEAGFDKDELEEFYDSISGLTEPEDLVAEASDAMWSLHGGAPYSEIGADSIEIAHPEKGNLWFEDGAQEDIVVHRFGRFVDPWLDDQTIIDEIRGEGGESNFRLRCSARTDSPPQMAALRQRIENIFFFNEDWLGAVTQLLRYAERKGEPVRIELVAYSPDDILRAIAASAFGYPGYTPIFRLDIEHNGASERFIGLPEWDGSPPDVNKVIADHFSGDSFGYFVACHFGTNRSMNRDIMVDFGLRYSVFREGSAGPERVRVQGVSIVPVRGSIQSISHMIRDYQGEIGKLVDIFMTTDHGFAETIRDYFQSDHNAAEQEIAKIIRNEARPAKEMYWCGDISDCDICGQSFAPMRFMIDAIFQGGIGANVCSLCFLKEGRGIGTGRGQVYEATIKGWRHVAG